MADEITINATIEVQNGTFQVPQMGSQGEQCDQSGSGGMAPGKVAVDTTEVEIDYSELTTPGWCLLKNLDSTYYIRWGPRVQLGTFDQMEPTGRLAAGEPASIFRLDPNVALMVDAPTVGTSGPIDLLALVFED